MEAKRDGGLVVLSVPGPNGWACVLTPQEARRLAARLVILSADPATVAGMTQTAETVRDGVAVAQDAKSLFQAATDVARRAQWVLRKIERRR